MTARPGLDSLGPYFAVRTGVPPAGFRPLAELSTPEGPLAARVAEVGRVLRTNERRVAASTAHLGLAARFWSVALGTAVLTGRLPDLDGALFALPPQGPFELWLPAEPGPPATAAALHDAVIDRHLRPLGAALRLAPGLLAGNAASALVGAARQLGAASPSLGGPAAALARELLARSPEVGAVSPPGRPLAFRRASCCLYYRAPSGGLCGDCVFTRPPAVRR